MAQKTTRAELDSYFENHLTAEHTDYVSEHNEELLRKFYSSVRSGKRSKATERDYLCRWKVMLSRYLDRDKKLDELGRMDINALVDDLRQDEEKNYSDHTIPDFHSAIRMFYKKRHPNSYDRPSRVRNILRCEGLKDKNAREKASKRTRNILAPQQAIELSERARNPRDRLLPIFLFECGARTSELSAVTLGDINTSPTTWDVTFHDCKNNKEDRELPLPHSQKYLQEMLESHPRQGDDDAHLFVQMTNSGGGEVGDPLSNEYLNKILKQLARRAELDGIDPSALTVYDFRHSSATHKGTEKGWGVQQMMWWFAWTQPGRAKTYTEDDNLRMKNSVKAQQGFEVEEEEREDPFTTTNCSRCEETLSEMRNYCPRCSLPLDNETAMKDKELRRAGRVVIEKRLEDDISTEELREMVEDVSKN